MLAHAVGVLVNMEGKMYAFQVDEKQQPITMDINIESKGKYSKGIALNEEIVENDPETAIQGMMDDMTQLDKHLASTRKRARETKSVCLGKGKIDEDDDENELDGSPVGQAIYFIERLLKKNDGRVKLKTVLFHLAKK